MDWLSRRDWLERLFSNQFFDYVLAPLIVLALSTWLVSDFIRTRRAVKRGEPLRVWYLRYPVYPGDPMYSLLALKREYPAIMLFGFLGLLVLIFGGAVVWVTFWPPAPHP